jgi:hypothetical protein
MDRKLIKLNEFKYHQQRRMNKTDSFVDVAYGLMTRNDGHGETTIEATKTGPRRQNLTKIKLKKFKSEIFR